MTTLFGTAKARHVAVHGPELAVLIHVVADGDDKMVIIISRTHGLVVYAYRVVLEFNGSSY